MPGFKETVDIALDLEAAGADILELGYPFSDPMADGAVNQLAANRALQNGLNDEAYLDIVRGIRTKSQLPIVVFSYLNPIFKLGMADFARRAKEAGVDGFLLVDMPVEESAEFQETCRTLDLRLIFLAAPTTTPVRLQRLLREASGFLYYISRTGITGERAGFEENFEEKLRAVKAASKLPVVVGFGISTPEQVRAVCALCDGAVVGSALVRRTLDDKPFADLREELRGVARALISPTKEIWP